jgi:hypothetical protein
MANSAQDDQIEQFIAVTHASEDTARMFVSGADGDLQNAIAMYFAGTVCWSRLPDVICSCSCFAMIRQRRGTSLDNSLRLGMYASLQLDMEILQYNQTSLTVLARVRSQRCAALAIMVHAPRPLALDRFRHGGEQEPWALLREQ